MADENTDVKDAQAVDEQVADATGQQGAVSQSDTGKDDVKLKDGQTVADATVPYSRFEEANATAKEAKAAAEAANATIATLQAQNSQLMSTQQPLKPTDLFTQTVERLGLQDVPYLSMTEQGQVFTSMMEVMSTNQANMSFKASHPDYEQVVGATDIHGNFVSAAPLQRVITQNPQLRQAIMTSQQGEMLAYELAVKDSTYQESLKTQGMTDTEKAAANAKAVVDAAARQASISEAGTGQGNVDRAQVVANWTEEELQAHIEECKSRAS